MPARPFEDSVLLPPWLLKLQVWLSVLRETPFTPCLLTIDRCQRQALFTGVLIEFCIACHWRFSHLCA